MVEEIKPYIDWSSIYALPFNHFFKDDLKLMRSYFELPEDGISDKQQAWAWLEKHLSKKQPEPWFIPKPAPSDEKLWQTEVPLWKAAIYLIYRYGLPLRMRNNIGLYIVTNDESFITNWRGLNVDFTLNIKAGKLQLCITVDGVDEWTTGEQWEDIWKYWVKPLKLSLGEPTPPNKRGGYKRKKKDDIQRWAEWYQLSELDGLGPAEALRRWDKDHPNEVEKYDESTVSKAVSRFRKLITPISI